MAGSNTAGQAETTGTFPVQASALKVGGYVVIHGAPCRVVTTHTTKVGKHGHAKTTYTGVDIFTKQRHEDTCPATHKVLAPEVGRFEGQVVGIDDGYVTLLLEDGTTRSDLRVPSGSAGDELVERFNSDNVVIATVQCCLGRESVVDSKVAKE